ncbi:MAG: endonuclease/exonuclease/phosphatase family protein [Clostridia bacterium]|nr:endonuclease/exonuclease/phosphatase family protein [Clostridia bacterium]
MKKLKIVIGVIVCLALAGCAAYGIYTQIGAVKFDEIIMQNVPEKSDEATRVMSFNVRCANDGEQTITNRSKVAVEVIRQYAPDSFGVQECTPRWKRIFAFNLNEYACVGAARDYYGPFTEYSSIYYLKDKYNLIDSGTFWLSETPEKRWTKSFDSSCYRIASWALLEDKETGSRYTHINTHLDHVLETTRESQMKVLIDCVNKVANGSPIIMTGDFNAYEDSQVYAVAQESFNDTKKVAENSDDGRTFTSYGNKAEESHKGPGAIDFIFTSKELKVDTYKIIRDTVQGIYPSDHYPIVADIRL